MVGWTELPTTGDELHHFGWNACSSALMHAGHHGGPDGLQRRFLVLPGLRSSNVHIYDTHPDPRAPRLHKSITPDELSAKAGYSRPHTLHCGPDGLFLSCLGGGDGADGPGGIALLDHDTFDVMRAFETDRGPQYMAYDAWWHLTQNTLITSEWGTPSMIEDGVVPELLLGNRYGHRLHFWDLAKGVHQQSVDLGADQQMVLEIRPAHDPDASWGYVGVVVSTTDLSASVWRWHRDDGTGQWTADKVITIPAEPAAVEDLPPALRPFGAVPPLVSDINLSVDDRMLYVSCWGTGDFKQYDVSDPAHPREVGSVRLGGIVVAGRASRRPRRAARRRPADGRSQPGRAPDVPDQLPVRHLGRPVLPRRRRCLDGEARHRPCGRRPDHRRTVLPPRRGLPWSQGAPGAARGRRRLVRLLLLPLLKRPWLRHGGGAILPLSCGPRRLLPGWPCSRLRRPPGPSRSTTAQGPGPPARPSRC